MKPSGKTVRMKRSSQSVYVIQSDPFRVMVPIPGRGDYKKYRCAGEFPVIGREVVKLLKCGLDEVRIRIQDRWNASSRVVAIETGTGDLIRPKGNSRQCDKVGNIYREGEFPEVVANLLNDGYDVRVKWKKGRKGKREEIPATARLF